MGKPHTKVWGINIEDKSPHFSVGCLAFVFILLAVFLCSPGICQSGLVWPKAPEKSKIEYLHSFSRPQDLKIEKKGNERFFDFIFGKSKKESDALLKPQAIFSQAGRIIVTDTLQGCVHVFDENKKEYFKLKKAGEAELSLPVGVAADRVGQIYVCDSKTGKVYIFSAKGDFFGELGKGKFLRPTGIAISRENGKIYVVDALNNSILLFNAGGNYESKIAGGLNHPTYIALNNAGELFVVDALNFRVRKYSSEGRPKSSFGKMGRVPGTFSMPKGIALDDAGNIYVTDSSFDNLQIFNPQGKLLLFVGESGNREGEFWLPAGVAIDEKNRIYVVDSFNRRVQVFGRVN